MRYFPLDLLDFLKLLVIVPCAAVLILVCRVPACRRWLLRRVR